jgi:thiol-disulfide isomerase/thioredoxin
MHISRRAVLAAATAAPISAQAQETAPLPEWLRGHPAMSEWESPERHANGVLAATVEPTPGGARVAVRDWLGARPTVLAVWATWCPPCMAEKRDEAALCARLEAEGSRAQIRGLLAYDRASLAEAYERLAQIGAEAFISARASDRAENALLWTFGFDRDRRSMRRTETVYAELSTVLPFTLLLDSNGVVLGRMIGMARRGYWRSAELADLMRLLAERG